MTSLWAGWSCSSLFLETFTLIYFVKLSPSLFSSLQIVPRFGPLNGRISVTIKGSNMGIKKEDIKKITVAGVDCVHQEDRYSVSTR